MNQNQDTFQLYERLANKPYPLFVFNDIIIPAATIWVGIRAWSKYFRELGLTTGDRIILSYPESPAFVHILFASILEKLTLVILRPDNLDISQITDLDVKLVITSKDSPYSIKPDLMGMPPEKIELRNSEINRVPDIRFILQSSGSTGNPKFICLTEEGILSVIRSHNRVFEIGRGHETVVLSILPWSHCFGLVLDLLLSTFYADCIIRDPENGKNIDSILYFIEKKEITHLSGVPLTFEKVLHLPRGKELLYSLHSGIIGGAPISKLLSENLVNTNFFVGYGQTEASPGICLGEKGLFFENYIGKPLGCEVKISDRGELLFRGENSFYGYWKNKGIILTSKDSWIPTGDMVVEKEQGLFFIGRSDFSFKLPNGIMIQPELIELELKEKINLISNCLLFYSLGIYLFFSSDSLEMYEEIIQLIRKNIHPLLRNISISILPLDSSEWIISPKGGVDRKVMIQKLSSFMQKS
ncbi:MAG: acyl--CoA ligase [Leptospiraceae bacterium]|nr:acyl--CoA ligase [Leptospiraceae bacterium]